jgi:hypothetical protein
MLYRTWTTAPVQAVANRTRADLIPDNQLLPARPKELSPGADATQS